MSDISKTIGKAIGQVLLGIFLLCIAYYFGFIGYTTTSGFYEIRHTRPIVGIIFGIMGLITLIFGPISVFLEKGEENSKKKLIDKYKK